MKKLLLILAMLPMMVALANNKEKTMKHELIKLPYAVDALEPVMSQETIEYHHGKHLNKYVENLNALIEGTPYENMSLEEMITQVEGGIFNNAGQIINHNLFFTQFSPKGGGEPSGELAKAINAHWGSFDRFKEEIESKASTFFGSGWIWLAKNKKGELSIETDVNASCPAARGLIALVGFDVWEHAYYIDYRNDRAAYIKALWSIVDWSLVGERYNN